MAAIERDRRLDWRIVARSWARFVGFWIALAAVLTQIVLALRLSLLAGEANASTTFVDFIYDVTRPLIQPFEGIIAVRELDNGGIFEPASAFAMGIYLIAALIVLSIVWWGTAVPRVSAMKFRRTHSPRAMGH